MFIYSVHLCYTGVARVVQALSCSCALHTRIQRYIRLMLWSTAYIVLP